MDFETEIRKLWREIERLQLSDKLIVASTRSSLLERRWEDAVPQDGDGELAAV